MLHLRVLPNICLKIYSVDTKIKSTNLLKSLPHNFEVRIDERGYRNPTRSFKRNQVSSVECTEIDA